MCTSMISGISLGGREESVSSVERWCNLGVRFPHALFQSGALDKFSSQEAHLTPTPATSVHTHKRAYAQKKRAQQ